MNRKYALALILAACAFALPHAAAAEPERAADSESTTLRLYFAPVDTQAKPAKGEFTPDVASLYVDDLFVGNAIVNLHGHQPILKFGKGPHTISVKMSDGRTFKKKLTFLGRGSMQILYVDFASKSTVTSN